MKYFLIKIIKVIKKVFCVQLAAFVPGLEPIHRALSCVDSSSCQHRQAELAHLVFHKTQLDHEERQELELVQ